MLNEQLFLALNVLFLAPAMLLAFSALILSGYRFSTSLWHRLIH